MSKSKSRRAWFALQIAHSKALADQGCYPWAVKALTLLRFCNGSQQQALSEPLPFYLDTGSFVSLIPETWGTSRNLARFLGSLSKRVPFSTAAGAGSGKMARVSLRFVMDPEGAYDVDVMVSPNLNDRDFGLLALGDVLRHYDMTTKGRWSYDASGKPVERPDLILTPLG